MNATTNEMKNYNKSRIYRLIYESRGITKQSIAYRLHISLPTITRCLNELLEEGKVICSSDKASTGGRPAILYHFNETAKIAIGVEVLADCLNVAAVDLTGTVIAEKSMQVEFIDSESYFSIYRNVINSFIDSLRKDPGSILSITVTMQGIVAPDGEHVFFGKILNSNTFTRSSFQKGIHYPVSLVHDAEVAAVAELWHYRTIKTGVFISLNSYLGTAVIIDGRVMHTEALSSGAFEHMTLHPDGNACYCGKCGCADPYCSANAIKRNSRENLDTFFRHKDEGEAVETAIWNDYLEELSAFIDNSRMVVSGDIIISGTLSRYMTKDDYEHIRANIEKITAFKNLPYRIFRGYCGDKAALIGAALTKIQTYLVEEELIS